MSIPAVVRSTIETRGKNTFRRIALQEDDLSVAQSFVRQKFVGPLAQDASYKPLETGLTLSGVLVRFGSTSPRAVIARIKLRLSRR